MRKVESDMITYGHKHTGTTRHKRVSASLRTDQPRIRLQERGKRASQAERNGVSQVNMTVEMSRTYPYIRHPDSDNRGVGSSWEADLVARSSLYDKRVQDLLTKH